MNRTFNNKENIIFIPSVNIHINCKYVFDFGLKSYKMDIASVRNLQIEIELLLFQYVLGSDLYTKS